MDDQSYTKIFYFFKLFDIHDTIILIQIEKANMNFNQSCMLIISLEYYIRKILI
jgi:hypothetical protein